MVTRKIPVSDPLPFRVYLDVQGVRLYTQYLDQAGADDVATQLDPYPFGLQEWDPKHLRWRER